MPRTTCSEHTGTLGEPLGVIICYAVAVAVIEDNMDIIYNFRDVPPKIPVGGARGEAGATSNHYATICCIQPAAMALLQRAVC